MAPSDMHVSRQCRGGYQDGPSAPGDKPPQAVESASLTGADRHACQIEFEIACQRVHAGIALLRFFPKRLQYDAVEIRRIR